MCIGLAWIILGSLTGLDDWVKKQFGVRDETEDLEKRVAELEKRLDAVEKNSRSASNFPGDNLLPIWLDKLRLNLQNKL